jgi:hypothetical protein
MYVLNKEISQKFTKFLTKGTLAIFIIVFFLGIFGCMCNMLMNGQGMKGMTDHYRQGMSDCPAVSSQSTVCPMSIGQHLLLQNVFIADSNFEFLTFFEIVFGCSLAFSIFKIRSHLARDNINYYRSYMLAHQGVRLYNYLLDIFSQGILQPKLFA